MIQFFRRIRKKLLAENKMTRYLIYAVGEIALVMIGILLALQVNNWNEQRKLRVLENDYLIALQEEFQENLEEAKRVLALNESVIIKAKEMAEHTGLANSTISDEEFAAILFGFLNSEIQYRPGTGVINEIISSGKLNIFRDQELKKSIASLDGLVQKVRFQERDELGFVRTQLLSILQGDEVSTRRMIFDAFDGRLEIDRGKFLKSNLHLLDSIKFDNLVTGFIVTARYLDGRYKDLIIELEKIIQIITNQLDK